MPGLVHPGCYVVNLTLLWYRSKSIGVVNTSTQLMFLEVIYLIILNKSFINIFLKYTDK